MSDAIAGLNNNSAIGFAIFDMWMNGLKKANKARKAEEGSPALAAASAAFEQYVSTVETQNAAMIDSVAQVALNPKSPVIYGINTNSQKVNPVTAQDMAPFLALNIMA